MATNPDRRSRLWSAAVPVTLVLAGVLFATSASTARGTNLRGAGGSGLVDVIRRQAVEVERRAQLTAALQAEVDTATAARAPGDAAMADLARRRAGLGVASGSSAVRGPGLTVTLTDAPPGARRLPSDVAPDDLVVHQQDVQAVVNALWAAGAEAMTIQDQRVIATSAPRCVGSTLILHGRVYSPPYVVAAIGEPGALRAGLGSDPLVRLFTDHADQFGLGFRVEGPRQLTFPAYVGPQELTYARPAAIAGS